MSLNASAIQNGLQSHAASSGFFERVNTHEPKNAPGNGLTCAIWVDAIGPVPEGSGLAATSAVIVFKVQVYTNMIQEPQDMIDLNMIEAVDALMNAFSGDFELGGNARNIDLLGQSGAVLAAQSGYIEQDGKLFRTIEITVPVIVNDAWTQAA